jgi:hypothetical protein
MTALSWHTFAIDAEIQRRAKRNFMRQAEKRRHELLEVDRVDAAAARLTVIRAAISESIDAKPKEHRCGDACG